MNGIFVAFSKVINRQAPNKRGIDFLTVYTEAESVYSVDSKNNDDISVFCFSCHDQTLSGINVPYLGGVQDFTLLEKVEHIELSVDKH